MPTVEVSPQVYQEVAFADENKLQDVAYLPAGVANMVAKAIEDVASDEPAWFDSDEFARLYQLMTGDKLTPEVLEKIKQKHGVKE